MNLSHMTNNQPTYQKKRRFKERTKKKPMQDIFAIKCDNKNRFTSYFMFETKI